MASVERRTDRPGYVVRWRDESNRQRKRSFRRKLDADRFRAEVEHSLNVGTYVDPVAGRTTFQEYAERWRAMQPHRPNTATRTKSQLHVHVYPAIGHRPIAAIRTSEVQALVTGMQLAPSSVRPCYATVRAIFGAALRDRVIGQDPCVRIRLPELPRAEVVPLELEQVETLADAMPPRWRAFVLADAATGLRQGELFGWEVPDVDFLRRTGKVERQAQPIGGDVVLCALKNRASYRTLPLAGTAVDVVAAHLAAFPAREVEVTDTTGPRPVRRMARIIFGGEDGRPVDRRWFNARIWAPAREAAGLPWVTCHDLRHWFASVLIGAGHNPKAVADRLGHADPAMTLRVYTHLWPSDEDRTRQAIDDVFRRDVPRTRPAAAGGSPAAQVNRPARPPPSIWR